MKSFNILHWPTLCVFLLNIFLLMSFATNQDTLPLLEKALGGSGLYRTVHSDSRENLFTKGNEEGPITGWFLSNSEIDSLIKKLVDAYNGNEHEPTLDPRDQQFIKALRDNIDGYYINEPKLTFQKPYTSLLGTYPNTPIYTISGWKTYQLSTNTKAVENFFRLFLAGAHFVILGSNNFLSDITKLPLSAKNEKHSHYSQTEQRRVFPNITWNTRKPAPIIAALLIDRIPSTNDNDSNIFFQLEGWPIHAGSDLLNDTLLHAKDYLWHRDTLWNISTYGLSPYSEKRGTTVFITKEAIDPSKPFTHGKTLFSPDYDKYADDER